MEKTVKATVTIEQINQAIENDKANTIALNRQAAMNWHIKTYGTTYVPRPALSNDEVTERSLNLDLSLRRSA